MHKINRKANGFTLIEMAIVMVIFGVVLSVVGGALGIYMYQKQRTHTLKAMEASKEVLSYYVIQELRYPCPADPTLSPDHPDYGYEALPCAQNPDPNLDPDRHEVANTTALTPVRALDADADGENGKDFLLFGAVPFRTIEAAGIQDDFFAGAATLDGWNNKITYAVPVLLTSKNTFRDDYGAFDVYDEHDQSVLDEPLSAHVIISSHGADGKGAYTAQGKLVENCTTSITLDPADPTAIPPDPVAGKDGDQSDNCDHNDEYFLGGLRTQNEDSFNDDYVRFLLYRNSELWSYTGVLIDENGTPNDETDDIKINQMANTNPGNIGIGTNEPDVKMHVLGDIKATEIIADKYCDTTGNNCMTAEAIAGEMDSMKCGSSETAVVSLELQTVTCQPVFSTEANGTCDDGKYMVGISNKTGVICESF